MSRRRINQQLAPSVQYAMASFSPTLSLSIVLQTSRYPVLGPKMIFRRAYHYCSPTTMQAARLKKYIYIYIYKQLALRMFSTLGRLHSAESLCIWKRPQFTNTIVTRQIREIRISSFSHFVTASRTFRYDGECKQLLQVTLLFRTTRFYYCRYHKDQLPPHNSSKSKMIRW
jgi:hypothetical protein